MGIESALLMSAVFLGLIFLILIVVAILIPRERKEPKKASKELEKIKSQINGDEEEW